MTTSHSRLAAARVAVATLFFLNGMLFATWVSRIPAVEAQRGMSHATLGLALLAIALGAMVSMPLAGALAERWGSGRVCRFSALGYATTLPLLSPGLPLWLFAPSLLFYGICHGALDVAMNAQAVLVEKRHARPIMASFHAFFSFGGLTGAVAGGLAAALGWSVAPHFVLVAAVVGTVALLAAPLLLPAVASGPLRKVRRRPGFRLPSRALAGAGVIALCIMLGEGAMADWSAVYLKRIIQTSEGWAAAGYAAFSIAMALGRLAGDRLIERFGAVGMLRAGASLALLGLLLALFAPEPAWVLAGFACVGAGFSSIVPMAFSAAGRAPNVAPAVAVASVSTLGYLGFLLGPPMIGFLAECFGLRAALGVLLATTAVPLLLWRALSPGADRQRSGFAETPVTRDAAA